MSKNSETRPLTTFETAMSIFLNRPWLGLAFIWLLGLALIHPVGEFSINDDFGFSTPVKWAVEDGVARLTYWQAMTLVAQVAIGYVWSEIFGFSYFGLRILTALLACLYIYSAYRLCRLMDLTKASATLVVACIVSFPVFVMSSSTFMTDTPFLAFATLTVYLLSRSLVSDKALSASFIWGVIFFIVALMIRQIAIAIALSFLIADVFINGFRLRYLARSLGLFLMAAVLIAKFPDIMDHIAPLSPDYSVRTNSLGNIIADLLQFKLGVFKPLIFVVLQFIVHFGFLTMPIGLLVLRRAASTYQKNRILLILSLLGGLAIFAFAALMATPISVPGNVLSSEGLGPKLITPYDLDESRGVFWWGITFISSLLGVFLLLSLVVETYRKLTTNPNEWRNRKNGVALFLLLCALASYGPFGLYYGPWFVRYVVFPTFLLLILLFHYSPWQTLSLGSFRLLGGYFTLLFLVSVVLAHDFFTWSRARYELIDATLDEFQLKPYEIDGGHEYNNLEQLLRRPDESTTMSPIRGEDTTRPYKLSKLLLPGYKVVRVKEIPQILPIAINKKIYLLEKL